MGRKGKFSRRKEKMEEKERIKKEKEEERIKKEEEEERIKREKEQEETAIEASYHIEDSQYRLNWLRSQEAIDISYDDIKILHSVGIHSLNQLTAKDLNEEFAVKIFKAFDATLLILKALAEYYVVIVIQTLEAAVEENPLTKWAFAIMSSSLKEFQAPEDILSRLDKEVGNTSLVERCSKILHTPQQFELYESYVRLVRDQEKLKRANEEEACRREIEEQEVEESEEEEALHRPKVEQSEPATVLNESNENEDTPTLALAHESGTESTLPPEVVTPPEGEQQEALEEEHESEEEKKVVGFGVGSEKLNYLAALTGKASSGKVEKVVGSEKVAEKSEKDVGSGKVEKNEKDVGSEKVAGKVEKSEKVPIFWDLNTAPVPVDMDSTKDLIKNINKSLLETRLVVSEDKFIIGDFSSLSDEAKDVLWYQHQFRVWNVVERDYICPRHNGGGNFNDKPQGGSSDTVLMYRLIVYFLEHRKTFPKNILFITGDKNFEEAMFMLNEFGCNTILAKREDSADSFGKRMELVWLWEEGGMIDGGTPLVKNVEETLLPKGTLFDDCFSQLSKLKNSAYQVYPIMDVENVSFYDKRNLRHLRSFINSRLKTVDQRYKLAPLFVAIGAVGAIGQGKLNKADKIVLVNQGITFLDVEHRSIECKLCEHPMQGYLPGYKVEPYERKKEVADFNILKYLLGFVIRVPPPASVLLISSDTDFTFILSFMKFFEYTVFLAHEPGPNPSTKVLRYHQAATYAFDWRDMQPN